MSQGQRRLRGRGRNQSCSAQSPLVLPPELAVTCHTKGYPARRCRVRAPGRGASLWGRGRGGGGAVLPGDYREASTVMADSVFEPQLHGWEWCPARGLWPLTLLRPPGGWLVGGYKGARCQAGCWTCLGPHIHPRTISTCDQAIDTGKGMGLCETLTHFIPFHRSRTAPSGPGAVPTQARLWAPPLRKDRALGSVRPEGGVAGATLSKMSA